jgi:hypothetical protein
MDPPLVFDILIPRWCQLHPTSAIARYQERHRGRTKTKKKEKERKKEKRAIKRRSSTLTTKSDNIKTTTRNYSPQVTPS